MEESAQLEVLRGETVVLLKYQPPNSPLSLLVGPSPVTQRAMIPPSLQYLTVINE